jgi:hypothetical protein
LERGGIELPLSKVEDYSNLDSYLREESENIPTKPTQPGLF